MAGQDTLNRTTNLAISQSAYRKYITDTTQDTTNTFYAVVAEGGGASISTFDDVDDTVTSWALPGGGILLGEITNLQLSSGKVQCHSKSPIV